MCCPLYIIRCDVPNFILSKSQKKVLKKMAGYLRTGIKKEDHDEKKKMTPQETKTVAGGASIDPPLEGGVVSSAKQVRPGQGPDPNKPPCRKAKEIRKERNMLKQAARKESAGQSSHETTDSATPTAKQDDRKPLEAFLSELPSTDENPAHKLTIRLVRSHPPSPEFTETLKESYQVYRKYQMAIHKDPPSKCSMENYKRFLVDSPLVPESGPPEWECGYGSYHQQYFIDGRLIMVGVVDILPHCMSSKYLYYDPEFDFLTLGTFSALNELALIRRLHCANPDLRYYCMGYYVHSCQKMRYKGQYTPSFLLCPVTNRYVPIETCRPKLDVTKYARFNEEVCPSPTVDPSSTLVLCSHNAMPYGVLRTISGEDHETETKVREYTELVGPDVSQRCLLFVS